MNKAILRLLQINHFSHIAESLGLPVVKDSLFLTNNEYVSKAEMNLNSMYTNSKEFRGLLDGLLESVRKKDRNPNANFLRLYSRNPHADAGWSAVFLTIEFCDGKMKLSCDLDPFNDYSMDIHGILKLLETPETAIELFVRMSTDEWFRSRNVGERFLEDTK